MEAAAGKAGMPERQGPPNLCTNSTPKKKSEARTLPVRTKAHIPKKKSEAGGRGKDARAAETNKGCANALGT